MADWTGMQPRPRVKVISSGGVVYRWENGNPLFLLLGSNKRGVRCLPKGLIEEDEDEVTTAMREVREETGVSRVKLRGKVGQIKYQFGYRAKTFDMTVISNHYAWAEYSGGVSRTAFCIRCHPRTLSYPPALQPRSFPTPSTRFDTERHFPYPIMRRQQNNPGRIHA